MRLADEGNHVAQTTNTFYYCEVPDKDLRVAKTVEIAYVEDASSWKGMLNTWLLKV